MTWIVGASSIFSYGVMISDVRISFADGSEADMLRKAYRIAPYILGGFPGSVYIGMRLLHDLQACLYDPAMPADAVWQPERVIDDWAPEQKNCFQRCRKQKRTQEVR